jgi:hypothetical protein
MTRGGEQARAVERVEQVSALVYALLHDLAAWLSRTDGPVNPELYPEYRLPGVGGLPSPRERMTRYLNPAILDDWRPAIERWLEHGYGYRPSFGRSLRLEVAEGNPEGPRARVTFQDRSEIEVPESGRQSPCAWWTLTVWVTPNGGWISSVSLQPARQSSA